MKKVFTMSAKPRGAKADLARFEDAYKNHTGGSFDWDTNAGQFLSHLFGNSRALTEKLIANPAWVNVIISSSYLTGCKPKEVFAREIAAEIDAIPPNDKKAMMRGLRHFKYREMIRIVARDLAGSAQTKEILKEWSDMADVIIDTSYNWVFENLCAQMPPPSYTDEQSIPRPCLGSVIALGKLGAGELNLSSDVDLLILYTSDDGGVTSEGGFVTSNHEFFTRLARELTQILSAVTDDGFLFRVDHELRPEGANGPLANSLAAAERYYGYFGHDWERQALIRARPVAGDTTLGMEFIKLVQPFVYRRTISPSDLTHMRKMKQDLTRKALAARTAFDIKLGEGGIREAEFLIQTLQLLYGGANKLLRCAGTFEAITALADSNLIHPYGARFLTDAYSFLRRMENMLQVTDETPLHHLPTDEAGLQALARRMGYRGGESAQAVQRMRADLAQKTNGVKRLFDAVFGADYELMELIEAMQDNLSSASNEEEEADSIAWFRHQESKRVARLDIDGRIETPEVLRRLTLLAEVILKRALAIATKKLNNRYGTPKSDTGKTAGFAIVGLGKLGSREMDYGSDLDLCFLYSSGGATDGKHPISNVEFFTKLAQRIISMVNLPTRYGRAYLVDSELRPSGRSGTLVATLSAFQEYHTKSSQTWERMVLLKARPVAGDEAFLREVADSTRHLAFESPPPPAEELKRDIDRLRGRSIDERLCEKAVSYNLRLGPGGIADLESIIQYHHLTNVSKTRDLWQQNTFEILDVLSKEGFINDATYHLLYGSLIFYRRLMSLNRLYSGSSTNILDAGAPYLSAIAAHMKHPSGQHLIAELERHREALQKLYEEIIKKPTP